MRDIKKIKETFKKCGYLKNTKTTLEDGTDTTLINYLTSELEIPVKNRTKRWIDTCLVGVWGNKKVKCLGKSDKIFEILNSIMEKI